MPNDFLRLLTEGRSLRIKALSGNRIICESTEIFRLDINPGFKGFFTSKKSVPTPETNVDVYEIIGNGNFLRIFESLPGKWSQKWLSQDQIVEFCDIYYNSACREKSGALFLAKKDEELPIDESRPWQNLVVINVNSSSNDLWVEGYPLEYVRAWFMNFGYFICPEIII